MKIEVNIAHKNQIIGIISSEADRFVNGDLIGLSRTESNLYLAIKINDIIRDINIKYICNSNFKRDMINECLDACAYFGFSKSSIYYQINNLF